MGQVLGTPIAMGEADPLGCHAQVALCGAGGEGGAKGGRIEFRAGGEQAGDGVLRQARGKVAARILDQGDQVIGGMAQGRALEIEDADAARAGPLGQPEQVAGEEVAMNEGLRRVFEGRQGGGQRVRDVGASGFGRRRAEGGGPPPGEQRV